MQTIINEYTGNAEIHLDGVLRDINLKTELENTNGTPYHLGTVEVEIPDADGEAQKLRLTAMINKANLFQNSVDPDDEDERIYEEDEDGNLISLVEVGETYPVRMIETDEEEDLLIVFSSLVRGARLSKDHDGIAGLLASVKSGKPGKKSKGKSKKSKSKKRLEDAEA